MDHNVKRLVGRMKGTKSEGLVKVAAKEPSRRDVGERKPRGMNKVALVDDRGAQGRSVEGAHSEEARGSVGRNVQEANTLGNGIRVDSRGEETNWTGVSRRVRRVVVKPGQLVRARNTGTGVDLCTGQEVKGRDKGHGSRRERWRNSRGIADVHLQGKQRRRTRGGWSPPRIKSV